VSYQFINFAVIKLLSVVNFLKIKIRRKSYKYNTRGICMNISEEIIKEMSKFGLTRYESQAYLVLLIKGVCSSKEFQTLL